MDVLPAAGSFATRYDRGEPQLVWTTLVADLETPVSAYLKLSPGRTNSFLLESVEGGAVRGRYSILGFAPDVIWRCNGEKAEINRTPAEQPESFVPCPGKPLEALRALLKESALQVPQELPPMSAGVFGYLGYETVRLMERLAAAKADKIGMPDALLVRPTIVIVFDAVRDSITIVTPVRPAKDVPAAQAHEAARDRIGLIVRALDTSIEKSAPDVWSEPGPLRPTSNTSPADYEAMVRRGKEYIFAGDIFQAVLSQRFEAPFALPPFALYRALRRVNPAPFLYFLDFGGFAVVGSSPEILVRVRDRKVTIRPIAGTKPRGATAAEDRAFADELLADPKERAEHLMLLDLGRNDVGRVARIGTVKVTERFELEFYSQVMHIVSNVEGELDAQHDAVDALVAGFPAGTVSGAPKVRAMEIIDELERDRRGLYAGAVGYFAADGSMDTCIVLRTALIKDGKMYVQAGAGIVADSDPASEQRECENKAKALFRAAEEAVRFASSRKPGA
jgi:anthranilate synthase component 1